MKSTRDNAQHLSYPRKKKPPCVEFADKLLKGRRKNTNNTPWRSPNLLYIPGRPRKNPDSRSRPNSHLELVEGLDGLTGARKHTDDVEANLWTRLARVP